MRIRQFPYSADNLGYLIWGERHAMAVDGGAVKDILSAQPLHVRLPICRPDLLGALRPEKSAPP